MARTAQLLATLLLVAMPATLLAAVPSPANSTLPACLTVCASGDLTFSVTVRDLGNNLVPNSYVVLDLGSCPAFVVCADCADTYVYDAPTRTLGKIGDASGRVDFSICGGGACDVPVSIYADGVLLGARTLAVTDQNGDLSVDAADVAAVNAKVGGAFPSADLDCDGDVDLDDEAIVSAHVGHTCLDPTPAQRRTWGTLKTIYR